MVKQNSHSGGPVRGGGGGSYVPSLNFKPFLVATSKASHVAVGISNLSIATDNIRNVEVRDI